MNAGADPENPSLPFNQAKLVGSQSHTGWAGIRGVGRPRPGPAGSRHQAGVTGEQARVGPGAQAVQESWRVPARSKRSPGLRL